MGPSEMFGELSLFDPGPRTSSATTVTRVQAASMDRDALREWVSQHPALNEQLLRMLTVRLRRTYDHMLNLGLADVPGRVAQQLLLLADQFGVPERGALRVTHDLTQEEIAQLVGATRETVNKALSDFTQRGWIQIDWKSVLILDAERLHARTRTGTVPAAAVPTRSVFDAASRSGSADQSGLTQPRRAPHLLRPKRIGLFSPPLPSNVG